MIDMSVMMMMSTISSVASFLVWGGGGGRPPNVPTEKKNHVHVNLYARASASETYIFSGLKIHLHTYTINAVPFYYLCYGALNNSILTKH